MADSAVELVFDGRAATLRALLAAFPSDAAERDAELALAFATSRLYDGLLEASATHVAAAERLAATVPEARRRLFDLRLASARLWIACGRGDLATAQQELSSWEARTEDELARGNDHRASALLSLGIAELWSLRLGEARRDLEEALVLARRIGRPYVEVGCLGHLALAAILASAPPDVPLQLSEEAAVIAEAHGWGTHRILAPAVAAAVTALAWLGRVDDAEGWLDRIAGATRRPRRSSASRPCTTPAPSRGSGRAASWRRSMSSARCTCSSGRSTLLHPLRLDVGGLIVLVRRSAATATRPAPRSPPRGPTSATRPGCASPARPSRSATATRARRSRRWRRMIVGTPTTLHPRWATIHALLFDAAARDRLGDRAGAEASIERALELAEPDGVVLSSPSRPSASCSSAIRATAPATRRCSRRSSVCSRGARQRPRRDGPLREELSEAELRVLQVPAEQPHSTRDRRRAVRVRQHRADAHAPHLREARRAQPRSGGRAGAGPGAARRAARPRPRDPDCRYAA